MRSRALILIPAVCLLLTACGLMVPRRLPPETAAVELTATPFHPQDLHQCGPAALSTVLGADGVEVAPETLADEVYVPGREGSFQPELVASVRRHGRVPVLVAPGLEPLLGALRAGKPVLVMQNVGLGFWPVWHYAVVVGYEPEGDVFLLRSGGEERMRTEASAFERTWRLAGWWGLVVAKPDDPPPFATPQAWIESAAPFETLQRLDLASTAYEAAVARWPDQALPLQALANVRYAQQDLAGAQEALQRALVLAPDATTRNNLASVMLERGCVAQAREQVDAIGGDLPAQVAAEVVKTRAAIDAAPDGICAALP